MTFKVGDHIKVTQTNKLNGTYEYGGTVKDVPIGAIGIIKKQLHDKEGWKCEMNIYGNWSLAENEMAVLESSKVTQDFRVGQTVYPVKMLRGEKYCYGNVKDVWPFGHKGMITNMYDDTIRVLSYLPATPGEKSEWSFRKEELEIFDDTKAAHPDVAMAERTIDDFYIDQEVEHVKAVDKHLDNIKIGMKGKVKVIIKSSCRIEVYFTEINQAGVFKPSEIAPIKSAHPDADLASGIDKDVEYFNDKLATTLKVPKEFLKGGSSIKYPSSIEVKVTKNKDISDNFIYAPYIPIMKGYPMSSSSEIKAPETELEKTACVEAVNDAMAKAIAVKKKEYEAAMSEYIAAAKDLRDHKKMVEIRTKQCSEYEKTLGLTKEQISLLF